MQLFGALGLIGLTALELFGPGSVHPYIRHTRRRPSQQAKERAPLVRRPSMGPAFRRVHANSAVAGPRLCI
jgi:hypothetical protein